PPDEPRELEAPAAEPPRREGRSRAGRRDDPRAGYRPDGEARREVGSRPLKERPRSAPAHESLDTAAGLRATEHIFYHSPGRLGPRASVSRAKRGSRAPTGGGLVAC